MSYQIEIVPALELLGAALNYAFRAEEAEDRIETSSSVIEWRKKVEKEISPFLSSDIEELFRFFAPPSFLRAAVILYELHTPEDLCNWLVPENTGLAQQLLLKLSELEDADPSKVSEAEVNSGLETYDSMFHSSLKDEVAVMLYALHNTEVFLRRLKLVLSEFYDSFVKEKLPDALEFLQQKRDEHQKLLDENGLKFLDQITLDNFSSLYSPDEEVRIVINYFANRFISLHTRRFKIITYGFDIEQMLRSYDTSRVVDQFLKALADPKRAAIMRLLKRREWYGKELADHFSLTTATMSYHIEKLLSSRLVQFQNAEKNRILYSINRDGLEEMLQLLREDFL